VFIAIYDLTTLFANPTSARAAAGAASAAPAKRRSPKDVLVRSVKRFQGVGDPNVERWNRFCRDHLGGTADPARHDPDTLKAFLAGAHPLVRVLTKLQSKDKELDGKWHDYCHDTLKRREWDPYGHKAEVLQAFFAECGIEVPAPAPFDVDAEKIALIKSSKGFVSRKGAEGQAIWGEFCKTRGDGLELDPAFLDKASLQAFVDEHGIAVTEPAKMRRLVKAVKDFSRRSTGDYEKWTAYCDQKGQKWYDPSACEGSMLEAFIAEQGIKVGGPSARTGP